MRLAVALRGIAAYDRVLTGEYSPIFSEEKTAMPTVNDGFGSEQKLYEWFARPSTNSVSKPVEQ